MIPILILPFLRVNEVPIGSWSWSCFDLAWADQTQVSDLFRPIDLLTLIPFLGPLVIQNLSNVLSARFSDPHADRGAGWIIVNPSKQMSRSELACLIVVNNRSMLLWHLTLLKLSSTTYLKDFIVCLRLLHLIGSGRLAPVEESKAPNFEALRALMPSMNRHLGGMSPSFALL
jgi:hypothetical protein